MTVDHYHPVRADVALRNLYNNVSALVAHIAPKQLMAVVKANGYGHGAIETANTALQAGAKWLGVANPQEGAILRENGIQAPILVLGAFLPGQESLYVRYNLRATYGSAVSLQCLAHAAQKYNVTVPIHVKVDTGMSRLGFPPDALSDAVAHAYNMPGLKLEGLYSHLACADCDDDAEIHHQLQRFRSALQACRQLGWHPQHIHIENTAAALKPYVTDECTLVRTGIGMYGIYPDACDHNTVPLTPVMSLKARVTSVKKVPAGTGVSYGMQYRTEGDTTLCTLPIGYADGLRRNLTGRASVLLRGKRHPIVGAICMDQCIINVGDTPVEIGEEVVLLGKQGDDHISAREWAELLGTIPYEVLCSLTSRVKRYYVDE